MSFKERAIIVNIVRVNSTHMRQLVLKAVLGDKTGRAVCVGFDSSWPCTVC